MNRRVYDLSMLLGMVLMTAGAGLALGVAVALVVAGGLLILLTMVGARLAA